MKFVLDKIFNDRTLGVCALVVVFLAFMRIHLRVQTTLIGYEIGTLKDSETKLLERRSLLKIKLAQMSTQEKLSELSQKEDVAAVHVQN